MKGVIYFIWGVSHIILVGRLNSATPQEFLEASNNQNQSKINLWSQNKEIVNLENCNLRLTERIKTVGYFEMKCGRITSNNLIQFGLNENPPPMVRAIKIVGIKKIGNKIYTQIEIQSNYNFIRKPSQDSYKQSTPTQAKTQTPPNRNLGTFLEMAKSPPKSRKISSPMVVFFDKSCPLRYNSVNHDFYWDNIILHEMEVTCLNDSKGNFVILVPGNALGKIPVGNRWESEIKEGTKLIAHIKLDYWEGERLSWSDPLFYYED